MGVDQPAPCQTQTSKVQTQCRAHRTNNRHELAEPQLLLLAPALPTCVCSIFFSASKAAAASLFCPICTARATSHLSSPSFTTLLPVMAPPQRPNRIWGSGQSRQPAKGGGHELGCAGGGELLMPAQTEPNPF